MANKMLPRARKYTLAQQKLVLDMKYEDASCVIKKGVLYWSGKIRPTALSAEYYVRIIYNGNKRPKTFIFGDNIKKIDHIGFPHKYNVDKEKKIVELCLYYPGEFGPQLLLADTIVPWAVEWLYHYEIWLVTGKWNAGGKH